MADSQATLLARHVGEIRELPSGARVKVLRMHREIEEDDDGFVQDHLCAVVAYAPVGRGAKSFLLRADWFLKNVVVIESKGKK